MVRWLEAKGTPENACLKDLRVKSEEREGGEGGEGREGGRRRGGRGGRKGREGVLKSLGMHVVAELADEASVPPRAGGQPGRHHSLRPSFIRL